MKKMKLTPEQKAFYEYGGAWETTIVIHTFIRSLLKNKGYQLSPELLHHYRDKKSHYGEILREAWKLRRKCRAWVPMKERYCHNCKYSNYSEWDYPCYECNHTNMVESIDQWEPRKETSNDSY